jgi:hypothetical protein
MVANSLMIIAAVSSSPQIVSIYAGLAHFDEFLPIGAYGR